MADRPILFSAPMVRALLAGTKTQTRRVLKPQPPDTTHQVSTWHHPDPRPHFFAWTDNGEGGAELADDGWCKPCPYGQPGDRLYVRETWQAVNGNDRARHIVTHPAPDRGWIEYAATPRADEPAYKWRPSIHMPRWASRILLEVTAVRVERLQDISEADCQAEGIEFYALNGRPPIDGTGSLNLPAAYYRYLWESINGEGSWDANPWVWVISFERVTP